MWMLSLMGYLIGAIIILLLFAIIIAMIAFMVFFAGFGIEYIQEKEGIFHKIARKIGWI